MYRGALYSDPGLGYQGRIARVLWPVTDILPKVPAIFGSVITLFAGEVTVILSPANVRPSRTQRLESYSKDLPHRPSAPGRQQVSDLRAQNGLDHT